MIYRVDIFESYDIIRFYNNNRAIIIMKRSLALTAILALSTTAYADNLPAPVTTEYTCNGFIQTTDAYKTYDFCSIDDGKIQMTYNNSNHEVSFTDKGGELAAGNYSVQGVFDREVKLLQTYLFYNTPGFRLDSPGDYADYTISGGDAVPEENNNNVRVATYYTGKVTVTYIQAEQGSVYNSSAISYNGEIQKTVYYYKYSD